MARITPGNRLYLYQLFSREIGVGKQTMLARVEEVLAADDIWPCDLECADVRELLEALDDFVRLSVFKKGRVYATVLAKPEWDELLTRVDEEAEKTAAPKGKGGPKSWKRKRTTKTARPAKPRPKNRPKPEEPKTAEEVASTSEPEVNEPQVDELSGSQQPVTEEPVVAEKVEAEPEAEPVVTEGAGQEAEVIQSQSPEESQEPEQEIIAEAEPESVPEDEAEPEAVPVPDAKSEPVPAPEPEAAPVPDVKPEPEAAPEPAPAPEPHKPSITLTVTYDPYEGLEDEEFFSPAEEPPAAEPAEPAPSPEPEPVPQLVPAVPEPPSILPRRFAAEVVCRNSVLSALYQILPFDVDPIALLDEDWRIARSTEAYTLEGGSASFPLRYLHKSGGEPLRVHMRRKPRTVSGKRWEVVAVGEPGLLADQIGFDGLPTEDAGAWSDLVAGAQVARDFATPAHVLALFARLGSWDQLLETLAELAAPEDWGEGRAVLREYLTLTFYRVVQQDRLVTAPDLSWAAFDTGLLTREGATIYMRFCAGGHDDPWVFESFGTETLDPVPEPASYVEALDDITFAPPYTVRTSTILSRTYGEKLDAAVELSLRRARRNYRVCTPAYDPRADHLRLLLPFELDEQPGALVLARQPNGGYLATAILSLERARACARVVSADLPSWLGGHWG